MQNSDEEKVQELLRELVVAQDDYKELNKKLSMVLKGEFEELSKKLTLLGRRIHRQYKKLSEILDKEK